MVGEEGKVNRLVDMSRGRGDALASAAPTGPSQLGAQKS